MMLPLPALPVRPAQYRAALTALLLLLPAAALAVELAPASVDQCFISPQERSLVRWELKSGQLSGPIRYTIRDWWEKPETSGQAELVSPRLIEVAVELPPGFHQIEFPATRQRFGLVALPAYRGELDQFFAIDSAMSWLVSDEHVREGLVKVLERCGVAMSRERLRWAEVSPAAGQWRWDGPRRYETLRQAYASHHVEVLEMFHDAPQWLGKVGRYPQDLVATAQQWRPIGQRWRPIWGALEVWNEPEIAFGGHLPADQYVPLVKAIAYGLERGKMDVPLVGGVFAHYERHYLDTAAAGGLLRAIDVLSFHTYGRAPQMEGLVAKYRAWLKEHGHDATPLWITECGRPWPRGAGRPPFDQDAASALDITMKAVEARACGIARHFPFVYPFYEERKNNFGMMGRHGTPLRSMAAYAQLIRRLAHMQYVGDLETQDSALKRARVFTADSHTIAVLYTGKVERAASVHIALPVDGIEGIDGRRLDLPEPGVIPVPDGLTYVWLDRRALAKRLRRDTTALQLWSIGQRSGPRRKPAPPILLRLEADPSRMKPEAQGYRVQPKATSRLALGVRVFNLDSRAHDVTLAVVAPVRVVDGPSTRTLHVPAEGLADAGWHVDASSLLADADRATIRITARAANLQPISPLAFDLLRSTESR